MSGLPDRGSQAGTTRVRAWARRVLTWAVRGRSGQGSAVTLGSGKLYLLGDNLDTARDSREFGPVDADDVVGRAVVRVWPSVGSL